MKASIEGAIEKLKGHEIAQDHNADDDGDSNKLERLLPKAIQTKRRKKRQEKEEEERASEEAARGRSIAERGTLENDYASRSTLEGDASSLITYDSDGES